MREHGLQGFVNMWPKPTFTACKIIFCYGAFEAALQLLLPGKRVEGPISPTGNRPVYKANGMQAYFVTLITYLGLWWFGIFNPAIVYDHLGEIYSTLIVGSFIFCIFLYIKGHVAPSSSDSGSCGNFIIDFYWGMELYPRIGKNFDIKVFTNCRFGMMSWAVLALTYCIKQYEMYGKVADSMLVNTILMVVYVTKFFWWEAGYWNTMDIAHDRAGFYPGRGHINPMFTLCNQLISSSSSINLDISFTIVLTEEWVTLINPNDKPENACFATIPNVLPSEHIRGADNEGFLHAVYTKMEEHVERIVDALEAPPNVIIADTFLPWVVGVGTRRNIPVASFWPLLACLFPALHHYHLFVSNNHYPLDSLIGERGDERVDYIPGIGSTRLADLPLALHSYKKRMLDLMLDAMSYMPKAQFIILRTLDELERPAIDAMKTILPSTSIYPIGPAIILPKPENNQTSDHPCLDDEPDYIKWLNSQPEKSVLYVSLGSHLSPSMAQLEELALGLCESRVPFLFVGREETSFLKDICGDHKDGLIVPWCDQMKVLYHKSIGGFLNHAGLNSVLESAFAGVSMLTFPLSTDQPMYSKLVVEDWKIGMRLRDKIEKDVLIKREKVKELVIKFMDFESEEVKEMHKNSKEFKQVVWAAIAKDSTAEHYVGEFLSEISTKNATN